MSLLHLPYPVEEHEGRILVGDPIAEKYDWVVRTRKDLSQKCPRCDGKKTIQPMPPLPEVECWQCKGTGTWTPPEREPKTSDLVCPDCGDDEIQVMDWVEVNTDEPQHDIIPEAGDYFCPTCQDHFKLAIDREDFKKRRPAVQVLQRQAAQSERGLGRPDRRRRLPRG